MSTPLVYMINTMSFRDIADLKKKLVSDEVVRANRFVYEKDAASYVVTRVVLRHILARELGCNPLDFAFEYNAHGKPFLRNHAIHFNVSHSQNYALIAIGDAPLGVDIQYHHEAKNYLAIAERYFTDEERLYINSKSDADKVRAFYDMWSTKEAYVKALGEGLAYGFDRFSVVSSSGLFENRLGNYVLCPIRINKYYSAALAVCSTHDLFGIAVSEFAAEDVCSLGN